MAEKIGKDRFLVLKCKDSFLCVCPEKDISSLEEKRGWRDHLIMKRTSPHLRRKEGDHLIIMFVFVLKRTSPHLRRKEGGETIHYFKGQV